MSKVVIRIKNGVAESIDDIPTDMSVEVRNYDIDFAKVGEDQLTKDADGRFCHVKEWHAPE
jgi:hypothetical protein